jgi:hypothetical protein
MSGEVLGVISSERPLLRIAYIAWFLTGFRQIKGRITDGALLAVTLEEELCSRSDFRAACFDSSANVPQAAAPISLWSVTPDNPVTRDN